MPTNRKVVDFKIHNLTEEQFQELKDAGQIDPNALYCTPDETLIKIEEINSRIDSADSKVDLLDSNTVHKTGDETISDTKHFIGNIKYGSLQKDSSYKDIEFIDTNGICLGTLRGQWLEDGNRRIEIFPATADGNRGSGIGMYITADGKEYNTAKTPDATSNTNHIATTAWVNSKISAGLPAGVVVPFGGKTAPSGWLPCNGAAVSRTTYADLFAVIGTIYGAGDGSTTFNLPNLDWRVPEGRSINSQYIGEYNPGSAPKITGSLGVYGQWQNILNEYSGAFYSVATGQKSGSAGNYDVVYKAVFDAYRSSIIYNRTDNEVHARNLGVLYIIKY